MQILGLYRRVGGSPRNILKTLNELHNAQLFLPIVFTLEHGHFRTIPTYIRIFPAFYSVDRLPSIPQILAESFRKDQGKYMLAKVDMVFEISIYLIDTSDMPSIYALAKGLAVSFHRIGWLNLWFERRCEIVSFLIDHSMTIITAPDLMGICIIFSRLRRFKKTSLPSSLICVR